MADSIFTLPFIAGVSFLMIFSYVAEASIFQDSLRIGTSEMNSKYESVTSITGEKIIGIYTFTSFLDINFAAAVALRSQYGDSLPVGWSGLSDDIEKGLSRFISFDMYDMLRKGVNIVNGATYWSFLSSDQPLLYYPGANLRAWRSQVTGEYDRYLRVNGYERTAEGATQKISRDLLSSSLDFLGRIPSYFGLLTDFLTFNVKDHSGSNVFPGPVQFIILVFMVPLWIILLIGILPYIVRIIEAIGSVLPDWL
jgi:hypothetical protein